MYVVVAVLLIAGAQLPVMPLVDAVGNAGIEAPLQNGPTAANVGVADPFTVIEPVAFTVPQPPVKGTL